ncbi:M4 family metallopeptidase [Dyella sp. GSA-30]|uniref:M4 family metallopeptidase n=1 Tax=Dyella sp. GSA-30 TaxID=2994496 RepID=UPI00249306F0|nr:M4 family metallopeptidase [Dyella sp. GSA-30]
MEESLQRRLSLAAAMLLGSSSAMAATKLQVEQIAVPSLVPMHVESLAGGLGLEADSQLVALRDAPTAHGTRTLRLQQRWQGIPVLGADVTVEVATRDTIVSKRGDVFVDLAGDIPKVQPRLSEAAARALWRKETGATATNWEDRDIALYVYAEDDGKARLAYLVSHVSGGSRPTAIIDADTGEILQRWEGMTTAEASGPGGNEKVGRYFYGVGRPALQVKQEGGYCTTNTPDVVTYHAHNTGSTIRNIRPKPQEWRFPCGNSEGDAVNGAYGPINDAHHAGGVVFRMYGDYLGIRPLKSALKLIVHVGRNEGNAAWNGQETLFGDGDGTYYPLVSLDVMAHEVSHGFTEQQSGLLYRGESGGMNEAFSDMAGEAAKWFDQGKTDYLVGGSIFKASGRALRYMCQPVRDGTSIDHLSKYRDGIGVHFSSGIYNKAFCLLSESDGWDPEKAFKAFARANMLYWRANETFEDGACGVQHATNDLGLNPAAVLDAFLAVGVSCKR